MHLGLGILDQANPVNWDSPLLQGIRSWNLALPNHAGTSWPNLVPGRPAMSLAGLISGTGQPLFGYQAFESDGQPLVTAYSSRPGGFNKLNTRMHAGSQYSSGSSTTQAIIRCAADSSWISTGTNVARSFFAWVMTWKHADGADDSGSGSLVNGIRSTIVQTKPIFGSSAASESHILMRLSGEGATLNRRKLVVVYAYDDEGFREEVYRSSATINRWTWNHVGYSYNGAGLLRLYVNGNLDSSFTGVVLGSPFVVGELRYGEYHYADLDFRGSMDDLRYYERFIEFDEYKSLYLDSLCGHQQTLNWRDDLYLAAAMTPASQPSVSATGAAILLTI